MKPISKIAEIESKKLVKNLLILLSIIVVPLLIISALMYVKKGVTQTINTTIPILSESITLGDTFQIKRILDSIIEGGVADCAIVNSADIYFVSHPVESCSSYSMPLNSAFMFNLSKFKPIIFIRTQGVTSHGNGSKFYLWLGILLPTNEILFAFGVVILFASYIRILAIKSFHSFSKTVVDPLEKFSKFVPSLFEDNEINKGKSIFETDVYEIYSLKERLEYLIEALKKSEIAAFENQKNAAIAKTTQMLAHDVRKPFSMLRMGLDMLADAQSYEEVKEVTGEIIPEVEHAISSVNGLIQDVMEIGGNSAPIVEPVSPEVLIESVLNEVFRLDFNADIQISFDFRHSHKVNVDSIKIHRVFSNILGNAIQAMKLKGSLWFRTREVIENEIVFVEFCIGNNGSFIPEECIPMLFNAFYTSGKKGGTGLGLAIAQKVVNAHSGKIWCTSHADSNSPPGRVEFWFTLPASECASNDTKSQLPQHSSEVIAAFRALKEAARFQSQIYDASEDQFEREISSLLERLGRSVRIHFVDDEPVYRNALTAQIEKSKTIASFVHICKSNSAEIALKNVQDFGPADFYILDIDLGQSSMNGFELITEFKSRGYTGAICIHSNRCLPSDFKRAMDLGAQSYLPKPMTRSHLLKFILITLSELVIKKEEIPLKGTEF